MTDHTMMIPGYSLLTRSLDGMSLRIAANLQAVLDLRHVDALIRLENEGPQLRVYRCAPRQHWLRCLCGIR